MKYLLLIEGPAGKGWLSTVTEDGYVSSSEDKAKALPIDWKELGEILVTLSDADCHVLKTEERR